MQNLTKKKILANSLSTKKEVKKPLIKMSKAMLALSTRAVENLLKKLKEASELVIPEERVEDKE